METWFLSRVKNTSTNSSLPAQMFEHMPSDRPWKYTLTKHIMSHLAPYYFRYRDTIILILSFPAYLTILGFQQLSQCFMMFRTRLTCFCASSEFEKLGEQKRNVIIPEKQFFCHWYVWISGAVVVFAINISRATRLLDSTSWYWRKLDNTEVFKISRPQLWISKKAEENNPKRTG